MSTPTYKGSGQPMPSTNDGVTGWLGGFLGGTTVPAYKTTPIAPPPVPCAPCPPAEPCKPVPVPKQAPPTQAPPTHDDHTCGAEPEPFVLDPCSDAVIPIGSGPITIVIQPRA
jgi:hypothetical protein